MGRTRIRAKWMRESGCKVKETFSSSGPVEESVEENKLFACAHDQSTRK